MQTKDSVDELQALLSKVLQELKIRQAKLAAHQAEMQEQEQRLLKVNPNISLREGNAAKVQALNEYRTNVRKAIKALQKRKLELSADVDKALERKNMLEQELASLMESNSEQ